MKKALLGLATLLTVAVVSSPVDAQTNDPSVFQGGDLFDLEWVADPQISPDGSQIVYVRSFNDIMTDRSISSDRDCTIVAIRSTGLSPSPTCLSGHRQHAHHEARVYPRGRVLP